MADETKTIELSNRFYKLILVLVVGVVVSYLGGLMYQFKSLPQNYPQQLSVTGEGKAYAKPDIAVVVLGVYTEALKSQDAVDQNNTKMNGVIKSIKDLGIEDKDIQTTNYTLNSLYDYTENGSLFKGYTLDQRVSVKIRDFAKISMVLDKATAGGANNVGDLQFTVDNPEKAKAEARALAIAQAKEKAESLFKQTGLRKGRLMNVYDNSPYGGYGYGMGGSMAVPMVDNKVSVAPDIQSGQLEYMVSVTLSYWIAN